jgi:hypothetical protein
MIFACVGPGVHRQYLPAEGRAVPELKCDHAGANRLLEMAKKRPVTKEGKPPPKCKAILLCNQTIIEAGTGKVSLVGIFDHFTLPAFPGDTGPFAAYLQMTDGIGQYAITIEVHDLQSDAVIARATGPQLEFPERTAKANVMITVPSLPLRHPGNYDFVVLADGQEVDRQQFSARPVAGGQAHAGATGEGPGEH